MSNYFLGFDVGGTKIEVVLVEISKPTHGLVPVLGGRDVMRFSSAGVESQVRLLARERLPTEREKGYDAILSKMKTLAERARQGLPPNAELTGVGIGLPGTIHPQTFEMLNGNTNAFVGHNLRADFEDIFFDVENVQCANDANCFALAEVLCGVGHQHQQATGKRIENQLAVGVILGTGCGAGVILNGRMIVGKNGGAGEMGHTTLVSGGRPCFCGRQGCAELYISGTGLELEYSEISGRARTEFRANDVFEWAQKGEAEARKAIQNYCSHLAAFLANMTNVIDPDYFVLGGGVSQQEIIYQGLHESVSGDLFLPIDGPKIYRHTLGDSAGVLGAALLPIVQVPIVQMPVLQS